MSKRVILLVEGQTEERFVKDLLAPMFWPLETYLVPTILVTKRVKDGTRFKGGVTNYSRFKNDLTRLLNDAGDALVSTIIDYYGLPSDFPGMAGRTGPTPRSRVRSVEQAVAQDLGSPPNFIPFFALHEFEAWLFSSETVIPEVMDETHRANEFAAICRSVASPEEINERPTHAPSKRILTMFPSYRKTLHGPAAARRIGLPTIRAACPHFADWLSSLESFAQE